MKRFFIVLLLTITVLHLNAQQQLKYTFTHYTVSSGLISNQPNSIYQDPEGYIWISSTDGLQRFDGNRYKNFRRFSNDSSSLFSFSVIQLKPLTDKTLCLLMENGTAGIFNTRDFSFRSTTIKVRNELAFDVLTKRLITDEHGNLFLLLAGKELLTWNKEKNEFSADNNFFKIPPGRRVTAFEPQPGTKKYWIGFADHGIAIYDADTDQLSYPGHNVASETAVEKFASVPVVSCIFFDRNGRTWIDSRQDTDQSRVYCYDLKKGSFISENSRPPSVFNMVRKIKNFMQQQDGTIWIYGDLVFARYNENENELEPVKDSYEDEKGISYRGIMHLYEDREKNIWTATANNGIFRFNPSEEFFTTVRYTDRETNKRGDSNPISIIEEKDGTILAGMWGAGLYRYDKNFNEIPLGIKGLADTSHLAIWDMRYSADTNIIWMSAVKGFYKYNQTHKAVSYYNPAIFKNEIVREIREDKQSNLWFGLQTALIKWNADKGSNDFKDGFSVVKTIQSVRVNHITIAKDGLVWVGTSANGAYVLNPDNDSVLIHFGNNETGERWLPEKAVNRIFEYDDSLVIIGTATRLLVYNRHVKTMRFLGNIGTISGKISAIEKDRNGNIWIATTSGLYKTDINAKLFMRFDRDDGIASDYFVMSSSWMLRDGRLLFGASGSFTVFSPTGIKNSTVIPEIKITGIRIMNTQLPTDSVLKLPNLELGIMDNSLTIEFSSLTFSSAFSVQYKLDGLDKDWIIADAGNQAIYSHLPPGHYTLQFRLLNEEGNLKESATKLAIWVKPPFWKTWWFYSLFILLAVVLLYWFDKERIKRKEAIHAMRTKIAVNMHEQLSSALGNINALSEMARIKADKEPERSKEFIEQIRNKSGSMINAVEDMLWSISPDNDSMAKTTSRMQEYIDGLNSQYNADIEIEVDESVNTMNLDMEFRHESMLLFKEMVLGLAKANAANCKIQVKPDKHNLIFSVQYKHEHCNIQQLTNLLHSQGMSKRLENIKASVISDINKSNSVLVLKVPVV